MTNFAQTARQGRANALARLGGGSVRSRSLGAQPVTFSSVRGQR